MNEKEIEKIIDNFKENGDNKRYKNE